MKNFTKFAALTLVLSASFAEAKKDKTKTETTTTTNSSGGTTTTTTTTTSTEVSTAGNYHNFIRQQQQKTNVIWDMPVDAEGESAAALVAEEGGVLFQLWTIAENTAADYLLDQKLVGAYLPKGSITIRTQDSYNGVPRIRVDQPFSVDFQTSNLVTGAGVPESASRVLAEHHLAPNPDGSLTITPAQAISGKPHSSGYIEQNGITTVNYSASSISAADPTKARGQEHFVLHALGDGEFSQTQLATAYVQVWPMTTGTITGVSDGDIVRGNPPKITVSLEDLYPNSDTYLRIYSTGTEIGEDGMVVPGSRLVLDQEFPENRTINIDDYAQLFDSDGPYRIELHTTTPFGTERLGTASFTVNRGMRINAMQIDAATYTP
ncbi:MAG: hypothetical protein NWT08_03295 [Akkermansiaceae bacterium]|jgi:hypothetical protein|nr:hypothetical protein [Akkermansiaceae bacterium]MDP4647818.1 hypothetical protein [Akkermansiaceae bacterium]MDP4721180.1 hypothetical protein [Akkermansiaceae bacterium]MDP4779063.1 hypothetical protein [Akkermansiaceae bacterium]MDP4845920.1 hypothetical protein [Akkermansiaceae bacterium]